MSSSTSHEDLAPDDVDWLEHQFFNQTRLSHHDLDWGPVQPMAPDARRAMHAALGMLAVALVGLVMFVVYSNVIMPVPAPIGSTEPLSQPSAASAPNPATESLILH